MSKADQIVRLTKGVRYDVASLDARLIRVSWTGVGGNAEDYDWGYYFSDDGTYAGPDHLGIEPEFWVSGDEPIASDPKFRSRPHYSMRSRRRTWRR